MPGFLGDKDFPSVLLGSAQLFACGCDSDFRSSFEVRFSCEVRLLVQGPQEFSYAQVQGLGCGHPVMLRYCNLTHLV